MAHCRVMNTNAKKSIGQIALISAVHFVLSVLSLAGTDLCAAAVTVTNTADSGPGTLRAALASAANGDRIGFSLATPAKITLIIRVLAVCQFLTARFAFINFAKNLLLH